MLQPIVQGKSQLLNRLISAARSEFDSRPEKERDAARRRWAEKNKIDTLYPDNGPLRRELYFRHTEFFRDGVEHVERAFIAANRIGKNEAACYEISCHMTGIYPPWWEGFRFEGPQKWWLCHKTWKDVRDVNQAQLLGPPETEEALGTGIIPARFIHKVIPNPHIKFGLESFQVKHFSGGLSMGQFKVYEQGWQAFESVGVDGIWLDELCPLEIHSACKMRTADTKGGARNGMIILTFTPVLGYSELVKELRSRAVNCDELGW